GANGAVGPACAASPDEPPAGNGWGRSARAEAPPKPPRTASAQYQENRRMEVASCSGIHAEGVRPPAFGREGIAPGRERLQPATRLSTQENTGSHLLRRIYRIAHAAQAVTS